MSEIPVTTMKPREYRTVFGFAPFGIAPGEFLVDIGSGNTDLTPLSHSTPDLKIIQIDPAYAGLPEEKLSGETATAAFARVPLALGSRDKTAMTQAAKIAEILQGKAARVTAANTLRYLDVAARAAAIAQMITIADTGLVQIYPVVKTGFDKIATTSAGLGISASLHTNGIAGIRQIVYGLSGLNNTLTIDLRNQQRPLYARDRAPLAKQIAAHVLAPQ